MRRYIHLFFKVLMLIFIILDIAIVGLIVYLYINNVDDGMWGKAWTSALGLLGIPAAFLTLVNWAILSSSRPKQVDGLIR